MAEIAQRRPPAVASTGYLRVLPPASRWVLHADSETRRSIAPVWGVGCSDEACRALTSGSRATLWLGPEEYQLIDLGADAAAGEAHAAIGQALEQALAGTPHALVDVSHRQFAVEVMGPHATTLLNGACPLDLDAHVFPVGMCTRTVLAKADIVLWRTGPTTFHLEAWRSYADYVTELLAELAREFEGNPPPA